jgi:hypothetical protein
MNPRRAAIAMACVRSITPTFMARSTLVVTAAGWKLLSRSDDDASPSPLKAADNSYLSRRAFFFINAAADGWTRIDLGGDRCRRKPSGRERGRLVPARSGAAGMRSHRPSDLSLVLLCRTDRALIGGNGHEHLHSTVVVHPPMHRRTDRLERVEHASIQHFLRGTAKQKPRPRALSH